MCVSPLIKPAQHERQDDDDDFTLLIGACLAIWAALITRAVIWFES